MINKTNEIKQYKPKVAFVCVHNACRSQMAEAIAKLLAEDVFEAYSAGTEMNLVLNQDAVAVIKELYSFDMSKTQKPKLITDIPKVDIVITMGCNVDCPVLPCRYREDWGIFDPTGQTKTVFLATATIIRQKVLDLKQRIENDIIKLNAGCFIQ